MTLIFAFSNIKKFVIFYIEFCLYNMPSLKAGIQLVLCNIGVENLLMDFFLWISFPVMYI